MPQCEVEQCGLGGEILQFFELEASTHRGNPLRKLVAAEWNGVPVKAVASQRENVAFLSASKPEKERLVGSQPSLHLFRIDRLAACELGVGRKVSLELQNPAAISVLRGKLGEIESKLAANQTPRPPALWPPPRTAMRSLCSRPKFTAEITSDRGSAAAARRDFRRSSTGFSVRTARTVRVLG